MFCVQASTCAKSGIEKIPAKHKKANFFTKTSKRNYSNI
uniref:Uncharacterized protein n=1 Tax=uncultured bacterium contig00132 TaxID=1181581 RepID=A0A806KIS5_9BACT|nr:hypothetical protein [uncultured bacterium contig00132]